MGRIYTTLKHSVALDPRIVEAFDSMLDADTPYPKATPEPITGLRNRPSTQSKGYYEFPSTKEIDAQRQYDAVVSEYRNTAVDKAPNGKAYQPQ